MPSLICSGQTAVSVCLCLSWEVCSITWFMLFLVHTFSDLLCSRKESNGEAVASRLLNRSRRRRHVSLGLADSQATSAQEDQMLGHIQQGRNNACPFCLPSWVRLAYEVGKWYVSNCRGGRWNGLTLFK